MTSRSTSVLGSLRRSYWRHWILALLAVIASAALYCVSLANGPERDLFFSREVPSPLTPQQLDDYVGNTEKWPDWFYSTREATILDEKGEKVRSRVRTGDRIRIQISPNNKPWKRFEILAQVTQYEPNRLLRLRILKDSQGKLDTFFDRLEWEIQIDPRPATAAGSPAGSMIRGRAFAHTANWRTRLFGALTERIVMAQVFYPNIIGLSEKGANIERAGGGLFPN